MGFEPTVFFNTPVFKTGTFNHSAIHPNKQIYNFMQKNIKVYNYIIELKYRFFYLIISLIICFFVSLNFSGELIYILVYPLKEISKNQTNFLIYTDLTEAFFASLKLSIVFSLLITFFNFIYQLYFFILSGLYKYEQKRLNKYLSISYLIMLSSIFFCYKCAIPFVWNFFINYDFNIHSELFELPFYGKIVEYINFVLKILFSMIICFQVPIISIICIKLKYIKVENLLKFRALSIVFSFILGAILSPPDIISQFLFAIPLCILYEYILWFSLFLNNNEYYLKIKQNKN